jgi:peptidoglycan DL-endopeptidase CwlO
VSVVLILSVSTTVFADPVTDSLNKQKKQLENQKNQYNQNMQQSQLNADSAQKDINNLNMQIEGLDSKIEAINRTIADTKTKITAKQSEIQVSQQNLDKAEEDIESEQDLFDQRMRAMYINGYGEYIDVLLSARDFSDFLSKAQIIVSIAEFDNKIIKELSDKKDAINKAKTALEKDRDTLLTYKQDNENKLLQVEQTMKQQQQLVAEVKSRQAYYMSQVSGYKDKIAAMDKQVQDTVKQLQAIALAEAAKSQPKGGSTPAAPNAIVAYAYKFLGDPYVWGADGQIFTQADINMYKNTSHDLSDMKKLLGKQAFDCSGLMEFVYAHFGINISRTTYTQIHEGTPVDRNNLKPGDLIFFGTYDNPDHVGMYVGNNCFIQAPYSGDVVKVSSLDDTDYLCARRILN